MADLSNLARQAASKPEFVAHRLAAYQQAKNLDDATLANQGGCSLKDLTHLRLCMTPRTEHFQENRECIANHVHAKADELTKILSSGVLPHREFTVAEHRDPLLKPYSQMTDHGCSYQWASAYVGGPNSLMSQVIYQQAR